MNDEIRPFRIEIPGADLGDLRDRIGRVRWPDPVERMDPTDRSRGIPEADWPSCSSAGGRPTTGGRRRLRSTSCRSSPP